MENAESSQREIATITCQSSVCGQFIVTYDAPKAKYRRKEEGLSTSCLQMSNKNVLKNSISFWDRSSQLQEQSLLCQSSARLDDMAPDSLEISFNEDLIESEASQQISCNERSFDKSLSNFRTPAKTSTPAIRSQTTTKEPFISRRLFDSIRTKFEKTTKIDAPATKVSKPVASSAPTLKSFKSLPRLDKSVVGSAQNKKIVPKPQIEVKPQRKPLISLRSSEVQPIPNNTKPKIQPRSAGVERKTAASAAKIVSRTPMIKNDAFKRSVPSKVINSSSHHQFVSKSAPLKAFKQVIEISPPSEKSPPSPNEATVSTLNQRKKWAQSSDVKDLSIVTLYLMSSELKNKSSEMLLMIGVENQDREDTKSTPPFPVFKSSDPHIAATLRRLEATDRNLRALDNYLKKQLNCIRKPGN